MFFLLFILGLIPFGIGYGLTYLPSMSEGLLVYVTAVLFLCIWFAVTMLAKLLCKKTFKTVGNLNFPGFIVLLLVSIQVFFNEKFWDNIVGLWTGYFFEPVLVFGKLIAQIVSKEYYWLLSYVFAYVLMLLVSLIASVCTKVKKQSHSGRGSGLEELARKAEESKAELEKANK